jgi:AcrR family transcriptional regulator
MTRAQRREHFLDVTAELVVEAGISAVTMERVAARAGVSKALGYGYFDNSDALLAALFDREMVAYDRAVLEALQGEGTFEARIRATIGVMFEQLTERGHLLGALLNGQAPPGSLEDRRTRRRETSERFIADLVVAEYRLPPRQARNVAAVLLAATGGIIEAWVSCRGSRRELTDIYAAIALGGLERLVPGERTEPAGE